jgi:hypothetical protein
MSTALHRHELSDVAVRDWQALACVLKALPQVQDLSIKRDDPEDMWFGMTTMTLQCRASPHWQARSLR